MTYSICIFYLVSNNHWLNENHNCEERMITSITWAKVLERQCVCVSHSFVFDSLWPHGLQPTRLFCPWNSPGKNTGVRDIPFSRRSSDAGVKPGSLALQADSLPTKPPGKPLKGSLIYKISWSVTNIIKRSQVPFSK